MPCRDKSYQWMLQWITTRGAVQTQHLSVATEFSQSESGKTTTSYNFIPSVGVHIFKYLTFLSFHDYHLAGYFNSIFHQV